MPSKMGSKLPTTLLRRPTLLTSTSTTTATPSTHTPPPQPTRHQVRHATFVPRHRRPYHFTQLVQLSDGSTFTVRTTMPQALYKSNKDSRNHILWQPSEKTLKNLEVDEAGKLAAFRERFGRGWDMDALVVPESDTTKKVESGKKAKRGAAAAAAAAAAAEPEVKDQQREEDAFDSLVDLISEYAQNEGKMGGMSAKEAEKAEKKKK